MVGPTWRDGDIYIYKLELEILQGRDHFGDLGSDGRAIWERILNIV